MLLSLSPRVLPSAFQACTVLARSCLGGLCALVSDCVCTQSGQAGLFVWHNLSLLGVTCTVAFVRFCTPVDQLAHRFALGTLPPKLLTCMCYFCRGLPALALLCQQQVALTAPFSHTVVLCAVCVCVCVLYLPPLFVCLSVRLYVSTPQLAILLNLAGSYVLYRRIKKDDEVDLDRGKDESASERG
jgi:hypothetical protein